MEREKENLLHFLGIFKNAIFKKMAFYSFY